MEEGFERRVCLLLISLALMMVPRTVVADGPSGGDVLRREARQQPVPAALRAYADPETGELVPPPAATGGGGAGAEPPGASEIAALAVVPAPGSAGGVMIDLRGQFMHATRAQVAPGGLVTEECAPKKNSTAGQ